MNRGRGALMLSIGLGFMVWELRANLNQVSISTVPKTFHNLGLYIKQ